MKYNAIMAILSKNKTTYLLLVSSLIITIFSACGKNEKVAKNTVELNTKEVSSMMIEAPIKPANKKQHPYGAWSCPDNLRGFPPVNVQELDKVKVVANRLPTKEETQSGTSLIFIDEEKYPNAKPFDIGLPRIARHYSQYTKKNELVVVIQAIIIDKDTIVGFRYLNGGNGSAWYKEVSFVPENEISELGATPFVSLKKEINASSEKIWNTITSPTYAKLWGHNLPKMRMWNPIG